MSLFEILLQYEKNKFGVSSKDLSDNLILSSDLEWIHRYFIENNGIDSSFNFRLIELKEWSEFPRFIYESLKQDRSQFGHIMSVCQHFLVWLSEKKFLEISDFQLITNLLKFEKKQIERLIKIHKHLAKLMNSKIYTPSPTDDIDSIELFEQFHQAQLPDITNKINDTFKVKSKQKDKFIVYISSRSNYETFYLKVDKYLFKLIDYGDILPLELGIDEKGESYILNYDYPLANHE